MTVDDWCEHGKVNNQNIVFKLDSGAQVNVIPERFVDANACHMTKLWTVLKSYTGHFIENIDCVDLQVDFGGQLVEIPFNVVRSNIKPILGKVTCEGLGLLKKRNYKCESCQWHECESFKYKWP